MDPYPYGTLNGLDTQERLITLYCLACAYLPAYTIAHGPIRSCTNGLNPVFTDAEVITLALAKELIAPSASGRKWFFTLRSDYLGMFPHLPCRTRLLRRTIALGAVIDRMRQWFLEKLGHFDNPHRLVDSAPLELCKYIRARLNLNKRFRPKRLRDPHSGQKCHVEPGWADIGHCASMKTNFFGMKLHVLSTTEHIPVAWCLTPASWDDRTVLLDLVEEDLRSQCGSWLIVWADSGYISQELAELLWCCAGHDLQAMPKKSSKQPWSVQSCRMVSKVRKEAENVFSEGARFLNFQHLRPASLPGLMATLAAKMTTMALELVAGDLQLILDGIL